MRRSHLRRTARRSPRFGRTSGNPDAPLSPQSTAASPASSRLHRSRTHHPPLRSSPCLSLPSQLFPPRRNRQNISPAPSTSILRPILLCRLSFFSDPPKLTLPAPEL